MIDFLFGIATLIFSITIFIQIHKKLQDKENNKPINVMACFNIGGIIYGAYRSLLRGFLVFFLYHNSKYSRKINYSYSN